MITPDRLSRPEGPSRRGLLRALVALPATALVLGELPGLLGSAAAAAPAPGHAGRYTIVPFSNSDDGTVNVYESDDATDFRLLKTAAYTPPSNRIRDAGVFRHTDGYYYLTYTTHTWQDVSTTIGFARGSDRVNWTFLYDYTVPIADLSRAWAPEWFVDGDGSYYYSDSHDTFATWSAPKKLPGISGTARHFTVIKETVSGGPSLSTGVSRSFQSGSYPTRFWQEQYNYPGSYLRHHDHQPRVDAADGTGSFRQDGSFAPVTAWA
ncbi:AbfB domain-containing protein [Streptomyces sp. NPDC058476]|uniref:AbfB domain-containing protein n=1 Tax=Streptomyces sp. NPDC058476 TaxID=3346519 RepID=UPI0036695B9B